MTITPPSNSFYAARAGRRAQCFGQAGVMLFALTLYVISESSFATPFTHARASGTINDNFSRPGRVIVGNDSGLINGPTGASINALTHGCINPGAQFEQCGNASIVAVTNSDFGHVGVSTLGHLFGYSGGAGDYGSNATANFSDTITIGSVHLPFGTLVQGTLELTVDAHLEGVVFPNQQNRALAMLISQVSINNGLNLETCEFASIGFVVAACDPSPGDISLDHLITGNFIVGHSYSISGQLFASSGGQAGGNFVHVNDQGESSASVDALHTAITYLIPGGDFFFASESGHDYSRPAVSQVPEPGSLVLVGLAFVASFAVRRTCERRSYSLNG